MNSISSHYDDQYFKSRYSHSIADKDYSLLLGRYWKRVIFEDGADSVPEFRRDRVLDYGCGVGQVSSALENVVCFDPSDYAQNVLKENGRIFVENEKCIPARSFDCILCSHSLDHYPNPQHVLQRFHHYVRSSGFVVLIVPVENPWRIRLEADLDQHLYCWTSQTLANLLRGCDWKPEFGKIVCGPFGLRSISKYLGESIGIGFSSLFGSLKKWFPSLMIVGKSTR